MATQDVYHTLTHLLSLVQANFATQVATLVKSQFRLQVADPGDFIIRIGS